LIIFDNHLHLRRDGRYLDAVKDFIKAGGTHFVLCQYPMPEIAFKNNSYKKVYQQTIDMADEIRKKLEVGVFVTIGPYPIDYLFFKKNVGRKKAINLMKKGMDEAAELCSNEKIIAIGEIGRPHFLVDEESIIDSNDILSYGMKKAKEVDVPVVLHTESTTDIQCKELSEMGKKAGLKPEKIVKHYSPPLVLEEENHGLMPSVLASKKNIEKAVKKSLRFMMETDYIDDPKRPGAVLGPKTVPKRSLNLLEKNIINEDQLAKIHVENPEKTYDIILEE